MLMVILLIIPTKLERVMTSKRLHKIKQLANSAITTTYNSLICDKDNKTTGEDSNSEGDLFDVDDDDVVLLEVGESSDDDESDSEGGAI